MSKNIDEQYVDLLKDILENGVKKEDRTGTGTISVFGRQLRHSFKDGKFPLLTTKRISFKLVVIELLWFLRGDTSIKYLVDNDCHIWDGDAWKNFCNTHYGNVYITKEDFIERIKDDKEFAEKFGNLGPIYGSQWRKWKFTDKFTNGEQIAYVNGKIDQIQNLINDLKTNPDSRRLMVNAWNVGELDQMVLPPCHYGFQVWTRELSQSELNILYNKRRGVGEIDTKYTIGTITAKDPNIPRRAISLMYNARSQDVPLGTPFNISSYALLLVILGKMVNMIPDELIANMGDCHIYSNQIDGVKEQLTREPYQLPTLKINSGNENWHLLELDEVLNTLDPTITFKLENYQSHPTIKLPLSN
jgi:thymidylate synthase